MKSIETSSRRKKLTDEPVSLFDELELKFDLMRVRSLVVELQDKDACLTGEWELLKASQSSGTGPMCWWRNLLTRARLLWLDFRRGMLADQRRWFVFLEGEFESALRLRKRRFPE